MSNDCSNVALPELTLAGSTFTGCGDLGIITYTSDIGVQVDCAFSDGSAGGAASRAGTVASRTTLTSEDITTTVALLPITAGTMDFNTLNYEASLLSNLPGDWSLSTGAVVSINADGAIYSKDASNGCVVNDNVSVVNRGYDAYALNITYAECRTSASALNGLTATGLAKRCSMARREFTTLLRRIGGNGRDWPRRTTVARRMDRRGGVVRYSARLTRMHVGIRR